MASPAPWSPRVPERPTTAASLYADGTYLISAHDGANTWAVCANDRWGIVYERGGRQLVSGWVDASDVPLDVLADALVLDGRRADR